MRAAKASKGVVGVYVICPEQMREHDMASVRSSAWTASPRCLPPCWAWPQSSVPMPSTPTGSWSGTSSAATSGSRSRRGRRG
ncbi:MAG: hypothetical protein ACYTF5_12560 [Planctomycetota bacterium]